jgi:hypothetical protein
VDQSPGGPRPVDLAHGFFSSEINPKFCYFRHFALKPLGFSKINPQSIIFQSDPRVQKIFTKRCLASEKSTKNSSKTSNIHIFSTTTPNLVIPSPKFSGSLLLSYYAFI